MTLTILCDRDTIDKEMWESDVERCGLILGKVIDKNTIEVISLRELPNSAPVPKEEFYILTEDVKRVLRRTLYIGLGYWHTHRSVHPAEPSPWDIEQMALYPTHVGLVLHPESGSATWFNHRGIINKE